MTTAKNKKFEIGGKESVREMLRVMPAADRGRLLSLVAARAPTLAAELQAGLFTFAAFTALSPREIQAVLAEAKGVNLALALKDQNETVRRFFYANLSPRIASELQQELAAMPPRPVELVVAEQEKLILAAEKLAAAGKIILRLNSEETIID